MERCERCYQDITDATEHGLNVCPLEPRRGGTATVIGDDIPGGYEVKHGLCNEDGTPRKYYTKSAMAQEAKRRGLHNHVEHKPMRGSDKSPHTVRWV